MTSPESGKPTRIHTEAGVKKQTVEKGLGIVGTAKAVVLFTLVGAALGWKEQSERKAAKQNERNQAIADALAAAEREAIAEQEAAREPVEGASDKLKATITKRIMNMNKYK